MWTTSHRHVQEQPLLRDIEYFPFRILSNVVGDPQLSVTMLDTDMDGIATVGWGGMILEVSTVFKAQLQVSFWLQLKARGVLNKCLLGEAPPGPTPYPFIYHFS